MKDCCCSYCDPKCFKFCKGPKSHLLIVNDSFNVTQQMPQMTPMTSSVSLSNTLPVCGRRLRLFTELVDVFYQDPDCTTATDGSTGDQWFQITADITMKLGTS